MRATPPLSCVLAPHHRPDTPEVDLVALKNQFKKHKGALPLPVMKNSKTVDPRDKESTKVIQLETAMGAAIECFEGATALVST